MKKKYILMIVIIFFSLLYVFVNYKTEVLKNNSKTTLGTISNIIWGHKNGRYIVNATFKVNGKYYNGSSFIPCTESKLEYLSNKLLGKNIIVVYDSTSINNCRLLLYEDIYSKYNVIMPDSLKWIDSLVTCK